MFYYLTDAFVLVLFHVIYVTSTSSMQKQSFTNVFQNRCSKKFRKFCRKTLVFSYEICEIYKNTFFYRTPWWLLLCMLLFMNVSSFTFPLPYFHYFLTVLLLSSFEETLSSLYHCYYIITIIIAE